MKGQKLKVQRSVRATMLLLTTGLANLSGAHADGASLEESCLAAADAARAGLSKLAEPIPSRAVEPHIRSVYDACYESPSADLNDFQSPLEALPGFALAGAAEPGGPVDVLGNLMPTPDGGPRKYWCAGGGSTFFGWSNEVYIDGQRFHVLNEPASSHYEIEYRRDGDGTKTTLINGHTRSAQNNVNWYTVQNDALGGDPWFEYTWDWFHIPMGGYGTFYWRCAFGLLTSMDNDISGAPLAVGVLGPRRGDFDAADDILYVRVRGTTCLVPC